MHFFPSATEHKTDTILFSGNLNAFSGPSPSVSLAWDVIKISAKSIFLKISKYSLFDIYTFGKASKLDPILFSFLSNSIAPVGLYNTNASIGAYPTGAYIYDGFLDELRITNKARYTSNFTAPTKEFPNR